LYVHYRKETPDKKQMKTKQDILRVLNCIAFLHYIQYSDAYAQQNMASKQQ
jgi:hypothetical protein